MKNTKWSSRKFWVAIVAALIATALLLFGSIDQSIWKDVMSATVFAYLLSQGVVDTASTIKDKINASNAS